MAKNHPCGMTTPGHGRGYSDGEVTKVTADDNPIVPVMICPVLTAYSGTKQMNQLCLPALPAAIGRYPAVASARGGFVFAGCARESAGAGATETITQNILCGRLL
jgi:hypothetical protein